MSITTQEKEFMAYWSRERLNKKKRFWNTLVGFPLGIVIVVAVFVNFFSGWYKRATMIANASSSLFLVLLVAGIGIVAFIVIFASYHRWDVNETRYKELLSKSKEQ